jgi:type II secretory pathway component PulK
MRRQPASSNRDSAAPATTRRSERRGAILLLVLVVLGVMFGISAAMLRRASLNRQEVQRREWAIQADWLVDSGMARAFAKLRSDPKYAEETWVVPAEDLGGANTGRVTIRLAGVEGQAGRRTLTVSADYPDRPHDRARSHRSIVLDSPAAE